MGQYLSRVKYCSIQSWPRGGLSSEQLMVPTTRNLTAPPAPVTPIKYANGFCCDSLVGCLFYSQWINVIHFPIFFRVATLVLGQSYDCPSTSVATLKNMGKIHHYQPTIQNKMHIMCIFLGIYCIHGTGVPLTHWLQGDLKDDSFSSWF